MPAVMFTEENMKDGAEITPGWYKLQLKEVTEKPSSKNADNTVWACKFILQEGEFKSATALMFFNAAMMKPVMDYFKCFIKPGTTLEKDKSYTFDSTIGMDVMGYVQYNPEFKWNAITDFRPVSRS